MPTLYMTFWCAALIVAMSLWRLRHWGQVVGVTLITAFVLLLSQALFIQLAISAGLEPGNALLAPQRFLLAGPSGWLALLVMPCGWLGPVIGLSLVERRKYDELVG
ncbi:MAG TPA: hypothetical protein VF177_14905 [Anaerolineae bacterium]